MQEQQGRLVRNGIDNSTINGNTFQAGEMTVNLPPAPAGTQWPVVVGRIPPRASAFQPRAELRQAIDAAREQYGTVVLSQVLAGGGGVGKSQLAAHYAREALAAGTELVAWVNAAEPAAVTDAYARAAALVRVPGASGAVADVERDAERFLDWLAATERSWLIVLDNTTDATPEDLWPTASQSGRGRVIATTRHRGAASTGSDRALVDVSTYSPAESAAYLRERMDRAGCAHLLDEHAVELADALGRLPLALAHAAAYMINTRRSSGRYLELLRNRSRTLDQVLPARSGADGYRGPVATALLLSVDAAQQEDPVGLALPALRLVALLDPAGHPQDLWATESVLGRLSAAAGTPVEADDARDALAVLHAYNLVTLTEAPHREVTVHALTARAARDATPGDERPNRTAADALIELWPEEEHTDRELAAVLRGNGAVLAEHAGDELLDPAGGSHPLLHQLGISFLAAGLHTAALRHWEQLASCCERVAGAHHRDTLAARNSLAAGYHSEGRYNEALGLLEVVVADHERVLGSDHPTTLLPRANLAACYRETGRTAEAISLGERVLADFERLLGPDSRNALTTCANLAGAYQEAGRTEEAIRLRERVLAARERLLAPDHPDTLLARSELAISYSKGGLVNKVIDIEEKVLADTERTLGSDHPRTLTARANLAASYTEVGRTGEAISLLELLDTDAERILGPDHPKSVNIRAQLAIAYLDAARTREAIELNKRVLADRTRLLGPDHPDTLTVRSHLANCYWYAGRTAAATQLHERVLADRERILGPDHPDTHTARSNIAGCYRVTGRVHEAVAIEEQTLADRLRLLGPHHQDTVVTRINLSAGYRDTGRLNEAITVLEQVGTKTEHRLGRDHPYLVMARGCLATLYRIAGRRADAQRLMRAALADHVRVFGPDHPTTVALRETSVRLAIDPVPPAPSQRPQQRGRR
ncbi:tetratricopeptide (TPR) repeat protein [Streptomyces sp. 1114.5]|uniref:tetratricopeptide repeat protein n=1 Tax=Streptomyces sp. 1114.5 TaxID=1938830 RepID=UPI000F176237|nr:tetratricopeptide repeat protein [Streptomyces sp. 1114.5]RKT19153.1 tetratricopeptide (TPR) repeat protein [Streptomyces sp. 1114.5]